MILNLYSVRDVKTGFLSLTSDYNDASAMRNFAHACMQKSSLMFTHPRDYELYNVGQFDNDTGVIIPCEKKFLMSGVDVEKE